MGRGGPRLNRATRRAGNILKKKHLLSRRRNGQEDGEPDAVVEESVGRRMEEATVRQATLKEKTPRP
jgi:hypothetical protein